MNDEDIELRASLLSAKVRIKELEAENQRLREALRRLYGCFVIDPIPLPKEVQRIVKQALAIEGGG